MKKTILVLAVSLLVTSGCASRLESRTTDPVSRHEVASCDYHESRGYDDCDGREYERHHSAEGVFLDYLVFRVIVEGVVYLMFHHH